MTKTDSGYLDTTINSYIPNSKSTFSIFTTTSVLVYNRFFIFFLNSVLRPFQDYFSSYEMGQSVGGAKTENPEKNHLTHLQAELGLSHMRPERGLKPHQTQWCDDRVIKKQRSKPFSHGGSL